MSGRQSPLRFKVYSAGGRFMAALREVEAAAALVSFYGDGASIRDVFSRSKLCWHEGHETQPAAESFDHVAAVVAERVAL